MKKSASLILIGFLVFGIFMNSFLALADDVSVVGAGATGVVGNSFAGVTAGNNSEDSGNDLNAENSLGSQEKTVCCRTTPVVPNPVPTYSWLPSSQCSNTINGHLRIGASLKIVDGSLCANVSNQIGVRVEKQYQSEGRSVYVSREVEKEGNLTTIHVQKTITFSNGTQVQQNLQIRTRNENGNTIRTFEMEREGGNYTVNVKGALGIDNQFFGNKSQLVANLSNGRSANVSILPDQAVKAALERLRIRNQSMNETNISLQERIHNNVPQVVYNVEANQNGKFLGIFKIALKSNTEVDASTGEVVSVNRPWWAFLVSVPSSQSGASMNESLNGTNSS